MAENQTKSQELLGKLKVASGGFDIGVRESIAALVTTLDSTAQVLAKSNQVRIDFGQDSSLWVDLRKLWRELARKQLTFWDADESEESENTTSNREKDLRILCGSLAKFTRNLVAGVSQNQEKAFENEPEIRRLIHYHTSWSAMEEKDSVVVARILTQTLSNMVTANEDLMMKLWTTYMSLPEDQVILIRLLSSQDFATLLTTFIFILNCIHGSRKRSTMLGRSTIGTRVCVALLDNMVKLFEADEASQGAQAFDVGYDILAQLIEQGLAPDLYARFTLSDEPITPHQTTLLKIVDSYLQSSQSTANSPMPPKTVKIYRKLSPMLLKAFLDLSTYGRIAIERALATSTPIEGNGSASVDVESIASMQLDAILPKVCEALVLVTQCIVAITLEADYPSENQSDEASSKVELKTFFIETRIAEVGIVEELIGLLRQLDMFLPRINFGKPVTGPMPASPPVRSESADPPRTDVAGFSYLKRDLVRLLGILSHGNKAVQDRVRENGGITVVMNMCVVDERNPYLREHAIFTLHNLLENNPENQAVVDAIKPSGYWDEKGELQNASGPVSE